jgi:hypothetical protein
MKMKFIESKPSQGRRSGVSEERRQTLFIEEGRRSADRRYEVRLR